MGMIQLFSRTVLDKLTEEKTNSEDFYYCLVTLSLHKGVMLALQGTQKLRVRPRNRTTIQEPWYSGAPRRWHPCPGALAHWCSGAVQCTVKRSAYPALLQMRNTVLLLDVPPYTAHCTKFKIIILELGILSVSF